MDLDRTIKSFYIAGAFGRKAEFRNYATHLRLNGVEVTSSWLDQEEAADLSDDEVLAPGSIGEGFAVRNLVDIEQAEGLLFFSSKDHDIKGQGGRHTEFGYAWKAARQVFLIGRPENVFQSMIRRSRRFDTYHEFFDGVVK